MRSLITSAQVALLKARLILEKKETGDYCAELRRADNFLDELHVRADFDLAPLGYAARGQVETDMIMVNLIRFASVCAHTPVHEQFVIGNLQDMDTYLERMVNDLPRIYERK